MSSPHPSDPAVTWFKSSYSGGNATECVECAPTPTGTLVRDSKRPDGPVVTMQAEAWRAFVEGLAMRRFPPHRQMS
ncbi:DUF397 domain-containing protein [Streptomyces sp. MUM 203J]|uniref:DUF397 domain-containing protein n=1 Tax=Streptomyces sp. MUM 203J TaxID=2791990 RepID=UPI001F04A8E0|nr:DUF397 domain-containing protein [Streptomyces sp. MUM 203J]MCH0540462.1 DUF397 domain-containing protein [Streptomyces sp. MUM 203J]